MQVVLTLAPTLTPELGTPLIPAEVGQKELAEKDPTAKSVSFAEGPRVCSVTVYTLTL